MTCRQTSLPLSKRCSSCSGSIARGIGCRWRRRLPRCSESTRAHVGFALEHGGEQVLANVAHVGDLARRYEAEGGLSFRGFIDELQEQAQSGEAGEAPILEEGSDGVRLMTVHKAKGLEFPIVILADMTARLRASVASRAIDSDRRVCAIRLAGCAPADLLEHEDEELLRDEAEGTRVAYVAATRARDLLVIPAVGDEERKAGSSRSTQPSTRPRKRGGSRFKRPAAWSSNRKIRYWFGPSAARERAQFLPVCTSAGQVLPGPSTFLSSGGIHAP